MGIKTRFNPMGGPYGNGTIPSAWLYTTETDGIRTLYFYNNTIGGDIVKVPSKRTQLQDYRSSNNNNYSTLPFFNHQTITSVDLKGVPFKNNSMCYAFVNCSNLTEVININNSVVNMSRSFFNCTQLNYNVQIPNKVERADDLFYNCTNLNKNIYIPDSATNMESTFHSCSSLNQNVHISNNALTLYRCFQNCNSLNQNIYIPSSVINMSSCFTNCYSLNQEIYIPDSVNSLFEAFRNCYNLNKNIRLPNNVSLEFQIFDNCYSLNQNIKLPEWESFSGTFSNCNSLNQAIKFPDSARRLMTTFLGCSNLNQDIKIPNKVTTLSSTFVNCINFNSSVFIESSEVSTAYAFFNGTSMTKYIYLPYRYINNALTNTRNSFNTAGYIAGTGVGNTTINGVSMHDFIASPWWYGYSTYQGNGTHWLLQKWNGADNFMQGQDVSQTYKNVVAPVTLTTYDTFPTALNISTYAGNKVMESITISNEIPWVSNRTGWYTNSSSLGGALYQCSNIKRADVWVHEDVTNCAMTFNGCTSLEYANFKISDSTTSIVGCFDTCSSLKSVNSGTSFKEGVVDLDMPDSLTNAQSVFARCGSGINTIYANGTGITQLAYFIAQTNKSDMNVYVTSPNVTNILNFHVNYSSAFSTNIYIPYMNSDGTYTKTYNAFYANTTHRNNATSNHYMYDTSPYNSIADYIVTVASPNLYLNTYRGQSNTPSVPTSVPFVGNTPYLTVTTFKGNTSIKSIECNNVPLTGATSYVMFQTCSGVEYINNLNLETGALTNMQATYDGCSSLLAPPCPMPNTVTQGAYIYRGCKNIGLNGPVDIIMGRNCINYRQAFNGCSNFQGNIYFYNWTTTTASNRWNGTFTGHNTKRRKDLHCYFHYKNGVNTPIYNILKGATYNNNATSNFWIHDLGPAPV